MFWPRGELCNPLCNVLAHFYQLNRNLDIFIVLFDTKNGSSLKTERGFCIGRYFGRVQPFHMETGNKPFLNFLQVYTKQVEQSLLLQITWCSLNLSQQSALRPSDKTSGIQLTLRYKLALRDYKDF